MSGKFDGGRSNSRGQHGFIPDELGNILRDTAEHLRSAFDQRIEPRLGHRDVRAAILRLLAEEPMHGYQIIQEIETRSEGAWKPKPGSVYPTLQLLVDEGVTSAQETDGKKSYSLTDSGKLEAENSGPAPWETSSDRDEGRSRLLPKAGAKLAQAAVQVARNGTPEQVRDAVAVIDDARRKLYAILAQE
jgi:DNA-binding PadR family transcriptional regulator